MNVMINNFERQVHVWSNISGVELGLGLSCYELSGCFLMLACRPSSGALHEILLVGFKLGHGVSSLPIYPFLMIQYISINKIQFFLKFTSLCWDVVSFGITYKTLKCWSLKVMVNYNIGENLKYYTKICPYYHCAVGHPARSFQLQTWIG